MNTPPDPSTTTSLPPTTASDTPAPPTLWMTLLVAGVFFMEVLDGTVISTALPAMAQTFHVPPVDLNVGMTAYVLTVAVFIPASGWITERFGARVIFTSAIAIFTLASLLCGRSDGLGEFIAMRVLQGIGGAMMVPVGRLVVLKDTPKSRLIQAIAILTWPALTAPIIGPALGGFITTWFSWRWIFYLNLPLGLIALIGAWRLIPDTRGEEQRAFDWIGFFTTGIALLTLMIGVELLGRPVIPVVATTFCLGSALLMTLAALAHFRRSTHPMLEFGALAIPTFAVSIWGGSLFRMTMSAAPFLLPLMFQIGFGLDAFQAGLLVLVVFTGNLVMKPATTPLLHRFGFRPILIVNGLLNVVALLSCAMITPTTPIWGIAAILFANGLVRSLQFTALTTLAFADIPSTAMNGANTLFSTAARMTRGLGIALGAISLRIADSMSASLGLDHMPAAGYRIAFVLLGLTALGALIDILRLAPDAGAHLRAPQGSHTQNRHA